MTHCKIHSGRGFESPHLHQNRKEHIVNTHKWVASLIVVTLIQGFFSVNIMKKNRETYKGYIDILKTENDYLHKELL